MIDKRLFESLMKSLYEAIELAESKCVIRTLQPNEKLPMDLLLLADPSETSIEKYIHKSKVFVAVEDALVVGVYVLMEIASEQLAKHDEMTKFSIPLGDPKKDFLPIMAFLCSDDAHYMTGQIFAIDGGALILR